MCLCESFTACFRAGNLRNRRSFKFEDELAATYRKDLWRHNLASFEFGYLDLDHISIPLVRVYTANEEGKEDYKAFSSCDKTETFESVVSFASEMKAMATNARLLLSSDCY